MTDEIAKQLAPLITQLADSIKLAASIPEARRLVSKAWLQEYFGVSATTIDKIIAKPTFPAPIKIAGGPLRWKAAEAMDWAEKQDGKRAERRAA